MTRQILAYIPIFLAMLTVMAMPSTLLAQDTTAATTTTAVPARPPAPAAVKAAEPVRAAVEPPTPPQAPPAPTPEPAPAAAASVAPDNPNLPELWQQILAGLELPSTRMLLSQQAQLVRLDQQRAVVQVAGNWMAMVQGRQALLEQAIASALGSPRQLVLEAGGNPPPLPRPTATQGTPVAPPAPQPVQEAAEPEPGSTPAAASTPCSCSAAE